ncbi:MAG: helix-turn-helix domain-containing protein [Gemmatimonas sp.]|nr:helix-turn-helix domain-containing protein [Gemmatimonas sp.]
MYDMVGLGRLVKHTREVEGLSQRELAERVGTSQPAVAKLEQGSSNPTVRTLARYAEALGLDLRVDFAKVPVADPVVERYKLDVDRTLLRENLRRSVDERLRSLGEWEEAGWELQRAVADARQAGRDGK